MLRMNPVRLREIRMVRGYTVESLSQQINVTKQAVSKYEKGLANPSPEVIEKIISVLDIPRSYLSKKDSIESSKISPLFFRTLKSTKQNEKELARIHMKWAYEIIEGLKAIQNASDFKANIPDFDDNMDIAAKAIRLREYWDLGLGPIDNLIWILEKNGIYILTVETEKIKCDAYSQFINNIPFIILNESKGSAVRWRFDLAHELGHLCLHKEIHPLELEDEKRFDEIEKEAHLFASNFLMPESSFANSIISDKLDYFVNLKKEWKVSIGAMIYRYGQLYKLNEQKVIQLQKQISKRGWRHFEPLDDEIGYEKPNQIGTEIHKVVYDRNSADVFLNEVRLPTMDIERLCLLEDKFFSQFGVENRAGGEITGYIQPVLF
jgi:Zn-dependent peptidase ImmA (M78 family)/DNA-binding XRE family transcriptional regulator